MKVILGESTYHYDKEIINVEELFNEINSKLNQKEYIFNHLIVDDLELFENQEQYVIENFEKIKKIQVIYRTKKQFVIDTWTMTIQYLEELLPQVNELAIDFYQNSKKDLWDRIIEFIDIIDQLFQSSDQINQIPEVTNVIGKSKEWNLYIESINKLRNVIVSLQAPIKLRDTILIADVLRWEVIPLLTEIKKQLKNLL